MKDKIKKFITKLDIENNYKKYIIVAYIVFIMVPAIIGIGIVSDANDDMALRSLANILLLVLFVVFFIYDSRKQLAEDWGLVTMQVDEDCFSFVTKDLDNATHVRMLLTENLEQAYNTVANASHKDSCKYEILMINPYSEYAGFMDEDIAKYAEMFETLAANSKNVIDIKYYSFAPVDNFMIINDMAVYIFPMTQKLADGRRLCKSYRGKKKGCRMYINTFNRLWKNPV